MEGNIQEASEVTYVKTIDFYCGGGENNTVSRNIF